MWAAIKYERDEWSVVGVYQTTREIYQNYTMYDFKLEDNHWVQFYDKGIAVVVIYMNMDYGYREISVPRSHRPGKSEFYLNELVAFVRRHIRGQNLQKILSDE